MNLKMLTVQHDPYASIEVPGEIVSAHATEDGYWRVLYVEPVVGGPYAPSWTTVMPPHWSGRR